MNDYEVKKKEEELKKKEYEGLAAIAKEAGDPKHRLNAQKLSEDLNGLKIIHFYKKVENKNGGPGSLSDKSPNEVSDLLKKTEYKVDNEGEAAYLADQIGIRTIKEVSSKQHELYHDLVEKKAKNGQLSKEDQDQLDFTRHSLRAYNMDLDRMRREGLEKGFVPEVLEDHINGAANATYSHNRNKSLFELGDKERLVAHLEKAIKQEAGVDIDVNKLKQKEIEEMRQMLVDVHNEPRSITEKYKDVIKKEKKE